MTGPPTLVKELKKTILTAPVLLWRKYVNIILTYCTDHASAQPWVSLDGKEKAKLHIQVQEEWHVE